MPLVQGKSQKAFDKNVEREMNAGKPRDQALAIAYSIRRRNQKKYMGGNVDEYAEGGEVMENVPRGSVASRIMSKRKSLEEQLQDDAPMELEGTPIHESMEMKLKRAVEGDQYGTLEEEDPKAKRRALIRKVLSNR